MRDVAVAADVALGTIYRYFASKDHLLAEVQVEWVRDLGRRVHARPPRGGLVADRVIDVLRRATRAMEAEPKLALGAGDGAGVDRPRRGPVPSRRSARSWPRPWPPPSPTTSTGSGATTSSAPSATWFSSLVGWVNNWYGIGQAGDELEIAAHLLLDQYD